MVLVYGVADFRPQQDAILKGKHDEPRTMILGVIFVIMELRPSLSIARRIRKRAGIYTPPYSVIV